MDKNLIQRLITGTIFVIVLVGCIIWNQWSFSGLFLLITILGLWEFYGLIEKTRAAPQKVLGVFIGALIFSFVYLAKAQTGFPFKGFERYLFPFIYFTPFLLFFIELFRKKEAPFLNIAYTILGWLYIALPFALWNLPALQQNMKAMTEGDPKMGPSVLYNFHPIMGFFILMWTSDSMAYVCGRLFGKHKLFERISPKKTWEGFIGGMLFSVLAGYIISLFYHDLSMMHWMILAGIVSITGMLGDLVESMFKRSIGVKDSGNILPGHGGILDRFDAVLLATPFVVFYFILFAH